MSYIPALPLQLTIPESRQHKLPDLKQISCLTPGTCLGPAILTHWAVCFHAVRARNASQLSDVRREQSVDCVTPDTTISSQSIEVGSTLMVSKCFTFALNVLMGCGFSSESGRRAYKNASLATHDIFIERHPGRSRGDDAFRRQTAGLPVNSFPREDSLRNLRNERGRLALIVRRKTTVDDMHERGELGSRFWPNRAADVQWDPYQSTTSCIQMRGGRLYKLTDEERKLAANPAPPPGIMGFQRPNEGETTVE